MPDRREFGIVGLGQIGGNLALQARDEDLRVVGYDHQKPPAKLAERGVVILDELDGFKKELARPRIVFLYVPAGPIVDEVLDELAGQLETDDILIDGGNSYWGDSIDRHERLRQQGLRFIDLGTSGGIRGARHEASFMAGGDDDAVDEVEPILKKLAVPGGYLHTGPPGTGHFVKLVHNGIEFGMLQAIAEGVDLLEKHHDKLDVGAILECWTNGSVIRSWLVELMAEAYRRRGGLDPVPPYVEDTGEVNWLVSDAMAMQVPIPVIAQSIMELFQSRDPRQNWARAIAMMRHGFGGHPFGKDEAIARERRQGRVGPIVSPSERS